MNFLKLNKRVTRLDSFIKPLFLLAFFFIAALATPGSLLNAQDIESEAVSQLGQNYEIVLNSGKVYRGKLIGNTGSKFELELVDGVKITIPLEEVKSLRLIRGEGDLSDFSEETPYDNASRVRYFLSPSGYGLKAGEAYYQNSYLVANLFHVGITDNFSIGGGFDLLSVSQGEPNFMIMPRFSLEIAEELHASVGFSYLHVISWDFGVGYGFGNLTIGSDLSNITVGAGYGFNTEGGDPIGMLTLAGTYPLSRRVSFLTENYFAFSDGSTEFIASYGLRFQADRLSADVGLFNNDDIAQTLAIGIPYVGFAVAF